MIEKNTEHKYNFNFLGFIYLFFIAVLLLGFFFANTQFLGVSRDYNNYKHIFSGEEIGGVLELFYRGLMLITTNYLVIIFIVLTCSFFIKATFLAKYSRSFSGLTLFLIYYAFVAVWVLDYTQFRNGLCISILMFSVYFLHSKNVKFFYFSVFFAIATHWSALPFLLLYPFVYSKKIRLLGYIFIGSLILIFLSGYANDFIYHIRTYGIGQKIGNDADVNLFNSLSLTAIVWFFVSYLSFENKFRTCFRLFFSFGVMQYIILGLFSLPVMAFRILEMYFFLTLVVGVFIKQEKKNYYFITVKVLIIVYLAYYYNVVFGVINAQG